MKIEFDRQTALLTTLDSLYEEYRDELPSALRTTIGVIRRLAANLTGAQLRRLSQATKEDTDAAIYQSKLGARLSAENAVLLNNLTEELAQCLPQLQSTLERLEAKIDRLEGPISDDHGNAEIDVAKTLLRDGRDDAALERLERLGHHDLPERVRSRLEINIGVIFDYRGDTQKAVCHFSEGAKLLPNDKTARCFGALAKMYRGSQALAFQEADNLRKEYPEYPMASQIWIRCAPTTMQFEQIENALNDEVLADSGVACALARRACDSNLDEKAEQYARDALRSAANAPDVLDAVATVFVDLEAREDRYVRASTPLLDRRHRFQEALELITRALDQLGPQAPPRRLSVLRVNKALIYGLLGQRDAAEQDFQRALEDDPQDGDVVMRYAAVLVRQRKYDDAVSVLQEAQQANADASLQVQYALALAERNRQDDFPKARSILDRVLTRIDGPLAREMTGAFDALLTIDLHMDEPDSAEVRLDKCASQVSRCFEHAWRARVAAKRGQTDEARRLVQKAADAVEESNLWSDRVRVAEVYRDLGLHDLALPFWKAVAPPDCVGPLVYELLSCAEKCRESDFIIEYCQRLRDRGYVDPFCLNIEVAALEAIGCLDDAVHAVEIAIQNEQDQLKRVHPTKA